MTARVSHSLFGRFGRWAPTATARLLNCKVSLGRHAHLLVTVSLGVHPCRKKLARTRR